ncbi:MAG: hypothetical protein NVS2B3_05190 [Vulcanimicrobiaceae bacterium]
MNAASIALVAAGYGATCYATLRFVASRCDGIEPFDDGPSPGRPPTLALVVAAALVGAMLAARALDPPTLALLAIPVVSLAACWYSDVRCGIVLDLFTLGPLGVVLAAALAHRDPLPLIAAAVAFVPFALAAGFTRGRGMGWGDVKLVALGAALLGLQTAILAFALACLVAVVLGAARGRRSAPIAFAPYLAGSIALALAFPIGL